MTPVGVRRAVQLAEGQPVSLDTVRRMWSYFQRHEVDKDAEGFRPGEPGYPSTRPRAARILREYDREWYLERRARRRETG